MRKGCGEMVRAKALAFIAADVAVIACASIAVALGGGWFPLGVLFFAAGVLSPLIFTLFWGGE